jgi:mRNA interferase MazF
MTAYKRGDIVLVPFPFSDQTTTKKRPAVVISSSRYNAVSQDTVIMAVTSQTGKSFEIGECLIKNWKEAGLPKPSAIKSAISTIINLFQCNLILPEKMEELKWKVFFNSYA